MSAVRQSRHTWASAIQNRRSRERSEGRLIVRSEYSQLLTECHILERDRAVSCGDQREGSKEDDKPRQHGLSCCLRTRWRRLERCVSRRVPLSFGVIFDRHGVRAVGNRGPHPSG